MADGVDTVLGNAAAAKPAVTPATPGAPKSEPAAKPGGNQDAAFRRLAQKAQAFESEVHELRERLARVEGQASVSAAPQKAQSPMNSWGELSDQQLDQAISVGVKDGNDAALTAAINEKIARATTRASEAARGVGAREYEQAKLQDAIVAKIRSDFGEDALNEDSPLFQAADRHFSQFIARYGKERVLSTPDFKVAAFLAADRELHAGERDRLIETQQENERLKRQMALERGGVHPGVPRSQESADALAKGDVKGAVRALGIFKNVKSDIERRYGPS